MILLIPTFVLLNFVLQLRNTGGGGHAVGAAGGTNQEHQQSDVIPEKGPPASPPVRRRRMPETPSVPPSARLSTPAASQVSTKTSPNGEV